MYLLDTNHCSNLILGSPVIAQRLTELGSTSIATCVIVRGELIFWAEKSEQRVSNLQAVNEFLADIEVLPVDDAAADFYGGLKAAILDRFGPREKVKRRKVTTARLGFSENDLWIAAIAKRFGLIIVSSDSDFERIAEVTAIQLESWI